MSIEKYVASAINARNEAAPHLKNNLDHLAKQGMIRNGVRNESDIKRRAPEIKAELRKKLGL